MHFFGLCFSGFGVADQLLCDGAGKHCVSFGALQWPERGENLTTESLIDNYKMLFKVYMHFVFVWLFSSFFVNESPLRFRCCSLSSLYQPTLFIPCFYVSRSKPLGGCIG